MSTEILLTERWNKLRYHATQNALWKCNRRFIVVPSGRRSGKTELAKRRTIIRGVTFAAFPNGRFMLAAPTNTQAKEIFWDDLKLFIPRRFLFTPDKPHDSFLESGMQVRLWNGARIIVGGLDRPERAEGSPLDGIVITEFGNIKKSAWSQHVRPALSTPGRLGWAILEGVPEGRNHYYETAMEAKTQMAVADPPWEDSWAYFAWPSKDILPPSEIEAAQRELDDLTFDQEYNASFINFSGRAYHSFVTEVHASERVMYNPELDLHLCFDFNVSPGIAIAVQEQFYRGSKTNVAANITACVGEVSIPRNSNTPMVCNKLISMYGEKHQGNVYCYGDATGGAEGTAKVSGSDWDLIKATLRPVFKERLIFRVPDANPRERVRVNCVNSRCKNTLGVVSLLVDPVNCKNLVKCFEGTVLVEGGSGELDKKMYPEMTHRTDALGYYIARQFPIIAAATVQRDA